MSRNPRRLGRGLDSLVSGIAAETEVPREPVPAPADAPTSKFRSVPTSELRPNPFQPRREFDSDTIAQLADSIKQSGIIQPITARPTENGLEIVAGERRWTAAMRAGLAEVPVIVRDATNEEMLELALIENIQREDLNAIDRAKAYANYCEQFSAKPAELAAKLGEDRSTVVNYMRLMELRPEIRDAVAGGQLSMGHARALLGVEDLGERDKIAKESVAQGHSVRQLENIVRMMRARKGRAAEAPAPRTPSPNVRTIERQFEQALKTKVTIKESRRRGKGKITIEYFSVDDFQRIANQLGVDFE